MTRPITLFTGQWAAFRSRQWSRKAAAWGYDGLRSPAGAITSRSTGHLPKTIMSTSGASSWQRHGLGCWTISNHLVGQCVCDSPIDERHRGILPARIWGDGDPEGVRQRAAEEMKNTARAAAWFGVDTVVGFTGSSIWITFVGFPPVPPAMTEAGYQDFADRWGPIIDVFDEVGVRFAHEVHPSEIAYDYWTTKRTLEAVDNRPGFGLNFDPSDFSWQELDPVAYPRRFRRSHLPRSLQGDRSPSRRSQWPSRLQSALRRSAAGMGLRLGRPRRPSLGARLPEAQRDRIQGAVSVEWEDSGMDREQGAPEALEYLRRFNFDPPPANFDAAFSQGH